MYSFYVKGNLFASSISHNLLITDKELKVKQLEYFDAVEVKEPF
jgi:hypothetical protein